MKVMRKILFVSLLALGAFVVMGYSNSAFAWCPQPSSPSDPDYQPHCGIWLCLPGGFPSDCGAQRSAFIRRIHKRGCSALPSYSNCTGGGSGSYVMGQEYFYPCEDGYTLRDSGYDDRGSRRTGTCVLTTDYSCGGEREYDRRVGSKPCVYTATPRPATNFIQITVDGETYPRYYY